MKDAQTCEQGRCCMTREHSICSNWMVKSQICKSSSRYDTNTIQKAGGAYMQNCSGGAKYILICYAEYVLVPQRSLKSRYKPTLLQYGVCSGHAYMYQTRSMIIRDYVSVQPQQHITESYLELIFTDRCKNLTTASMLLQ